MIRVAVITVGASGIGLGVARRLVAAGHRVAVIDLQPDLHGTRYAAYLDALPGQPPWAA